jgi:regulator of sigma E protease
VIGLLALVVGGGFVIGALLLARFAAARIFGVRARGAWLFGAGDAWSDVSLGKRASFAASGLAGYWCGIAIIVAAGFMIGGEPHVDETSMRVTVAPGGPADRAGIRNGDRIVDVDGVSVHDWDGLKSEVARHPDEQIGVKIERDGQPLVLHVTPLGGGMTKGKILVAPMTERRDIGFGAALGEGFATPVKVMSALARGVVRMLAGSERPETSGPVGIVRETQSTAQQNGLGTALRLVGMLASYFFFVAVIFSLATFPRARKKIDAASAPSA